MINKINEISKTDCKKRLVMKKKYYKYKNMYVTIINIYVSHEVKYHRAIAKRTSHMMLNGQDVNIIMRSGTRCSR